MVWLTLLHGRDTHTLDVDDDVEPQTLVFQVASLVDDVAPMDLVVCGALAGGGPLTVASAEADPPPRLAPLTADTVLCVLQAEYPTAPHDPTATANDAAAGAGVAWQHACTRLLTGNTAVVQPACRVAGTVVCTACAATCMGGAGVASLLTEPFVCQCGLQLGGCRFPATGSAAGGAPASTAATRALRAANDAATAAAQSELQVFASQFTSHRDGIFRMLQRLQSAAVHVRQYESPKLQAAALAAMPVPVLHQRAAAARKPQPTFRLELLYQLLRWFKREFFKWVNAPPCDTCGGGTSAVGATAPTASEAAGRPGVVEVYRCNAPACGAMTRFPRYNNPETLLTWRRGRCGEWANCFTLCCVAMGYDARHVHDWTDHVWTEVWSQHHRRWLHLDACETAFDSPLLYEAGWGKKLTYVVAFGKDEVVDVTRRYTKRLPEVLVRRTLVPEPFIEGAVSILDSMQKRGSRASRHRLDVLARRKAHEVRELERNVAFDTGVRQADEMQGRVSGSLAWRASRGELGDTGTGAGAGAGATAAPTGGDGGYRPQTAGFALLYAPPATVALRREVERAWVVAGTAAACRDIQLLSSFGDLLLGLNVAHELVWIAVKALTASESPAWKRVTVVAAAAGPPGALRGTTPAPLPFPVDDATVTALAACPGSMAAFLADSNRRLWLMQPGTGVGADGKRRKEWDAVLCGPAPGGVHAMCVLDGVLHAVVGDSSAPWSWRLHTMQQRVADAVAGAKAVLAGTAHRVFETDDGATWDDVCDAAFVTHVTGVSGRLLGVSHSQLVVHTPPPPPLAATPSSPPAAEPPDCGVRLALPCHARLGERFSVHVAYDDTCVRTPGDWVALCPVGMPTEHAAAFVDLVDVSLPEFEWPASALPDAPGVYELRFMLGYGYGHMLCVSGATMRVSAAGVPLATVAKVVADADAPAAAGGAGAGAGASASTGADDDDDDDDVTLVTSVSDTWEPRAAAAGDLPHDASVVTRAAWKPADPRRHVVAAGTTHAADLGVTASTVVGSVHGVLDPAPPVAGCVEVPPIGRQPALVALAPDDVTTTGVGPSSDAHPPPHATDGTGATFWQSPQVATPTAPVGLTLTLPPGVCIVGYTVAAGAAPGPCLPIGWRVSARPRAGGDWQVVDERTNLAVYVNKRKDPRSMFVSTPVPAAELRFEATTVAEPASASGTALGGLTVLVSVGDAPPAALPHASRGSLLCGVGGTGRRWTPLAPAHNVQALAGVKGGAVVVATTSGELWRVALPRSLPWE